MTTLKELAALLDDLGLRWSNGTWADPQWPAPPFCVLVAQDSENAAADGGVWATATPYCLQLYCEARDYKLEAKIQKAFDKLPIFWQKATVNLDQEHLVETLYYLPPIQEPTE